MLTLIRFLSDMTSSSAEEFLSFLKHYYPKLTLFKADVIKFKADVINY